MNLSKSLSDTIKLSSFVSMILIVMVHAYNITDNSASNNPLTFWIENIISNGISRVAVPIFFLTSGFLFFNNKVISYSSFFIKQTIKRFRTIGIPFLTWSLIGFTLFCLLQLIPQIKPIYNNFLLEDLSIFLFIKKWLLYPIPFQLWFLQVLIICTLLAPLIWELLSQTIISYLFLFILTIMWFLWGGHNGLKEYTFEGVLFFTCGVWIARYNTNILTKKYNGLSFVILFSILTGTKIVLLTTTGQWQLSYLIGKIAILTGIPAFWFFIKWLNKQLSSNIWFVNFTFWLFLTHEPLLTFTKKILFIIIPQHSSMSHLTVYFAAPTAVIIGTLLIGKQISLRIPRVYSFLTGGR